MTFIKRIYQRCPNCGNKMTDDLSLSEDAFIFGDGVMKKKETVTLEKKVYDVVLKNNARLMEENEKLRGALEFILEATKKDNPSIEALRFVAYTALKGE